MDAAPPVFVTGSTPGAQGVTDTDRLPSVAAVSDREWGVHSAQCSASGPHRDTASYEALARIDTRAAPSSVPREEPETGGPPPRPWRDEGEREPAWPRPRPVWRAVPPAEEAPSSAPEQVTASRGRVVAMPGPIRTALVSPSRKAVLGVALCLVVLVVGLGVRWALAAEHAEPTRVATSVTSGTEAGGERGPTATASAPDEADTPSPPPSETAVVGAPPSSGGESAPDAPPGGETTATSVRVHVAGKVATPSVVSVPSGARVVDAITAAGGMAKDADLASVNLARPAVDGEQIVVLAHGEQAPPQAPAPAKPGVSASSPAAQSPAGTAQVNLNTADLAQLETLPGVGPVLAERIIQWRTDNGKFTSVEDLDEVSGVGEKTFERLAPLVTV